MARKVNLSSMLGQGFFLARRACPISFISAFLFFHLSFLCFFFFPFFISPRIRTLWLDLSSHFHSLDKTDHRSGKVQLQNQFQQVFNFELLITENTTICFLSQSSCKADASSIILCAWMFCLHVYLCIMCVATEGRSGIGSPGTAVTDVCEPTCVCWVTNPGPLEEHSVLFTELRDWTISQSSWNSIFQGPVLSMPSSKVISLMILH